jgi:hypothetical protein
VFFFDEAHLLFNEAPPALLEKIEQVVRLIRSKGVGVYFVTQNPLDIPDKVLGQLGNRVQHALRAFTPRDQKAVATAAETLRPNPAFDAAAAITELGVGEALISFLDEKGRPTVVERAFILPPASRIGPLTNRRPKPRRRPAAAGSVVWATCSAARPGRAAAGAKVWVRHWPNRQRAPSARRSGARSSAACSARCSAAARGAADRCACGGELSPPAAQIFTPFLLSPQDNSGTSGCRRSCR